jgi:hypothetical protein
VARVEARVAGEAQDLLVDRGVERPRISLLEVGAAAPADEEGVAGERHPRLRADVRDAAVGVARGAARLERKAPEGDRVAVPHEPVRGAHAGPLPQDETAAESRPERAARGHVVGVDVGLERLRELELQLLEELDVPLELLPHGVDQQRLARHLVRQEVGVGGRRGVEELAEDHGARLPESVY